MEPRELLRNLLVMAAADGSISQGEMELLADRCTQWGVTDDEFADMIELAVGGKAELHIPPDLKDRESLLHEFVHMMAADGQLAETEKHLFAAAAAIMRVSSARLNAIIDRALGEQEGLG